LGLALHLLAVLEGTIPVGEEVQTRIPKTTNQSIQTVMGLLTHKMSIQMIPSSVVVRQRAILGT